MIEKQWDADRIRDRLQMRAVQARRPLTCILELTYRCNFCCRMCYVRMSDLQAAQYGRMRTVDEWTGMAKQLYRAGVLYLTLTGGECTQYPGFETLYEQLSRMGFYISIMSNAGAYSDSIRELFRRYPPYHASITLYGGCNDTYRVVTGDPEGFGKTAENIRFFQSIGVPVSINFTVIRQNVRDYPKIGEFCGKLGLSYTLATDITGHMRDVRFSTALEDRLSPAQRACLACHPPSEVETALENAKKLERELEHFQMPEPPSGEQPTEMDSCIGSFSGCAISWNGDMQTCISMNGFQSVKPFETGFETAWSQLQAAREELFRRPGVCQVCDMAQDCIHNCAGRRYEGTGSLQTPDPYTCQYTYLLRIYREQKKIEQNINAKEKGDDAHETIRGSAIICR